MKNNRELFTRNRQLNLFRGLAAVAIDAYRRSKRSADVSVTVSRERECPTDVSATVSRERESQTDISATVSRERESQADGYVGGLILFAGFSSDTNIMLNL
jgi:hypothetical protein